jgi:hypothetical protein
MNPTLKQPSRLILKLLAMAFVIMLADHCVGAVLKIFYFRQQHGERAKATWIMDSTTAEILIFGSSRASHSYVAGIFAENAHLSCYNTGRDGSFVLYNYALFRAVIERYNPKMVIFDILPTDLEYDADEYERLSLLLPYYDDHPEIRQILDLRGPAEKIKRISAIYPYNSLVFQIAMGYFDADKFRIGEEMGYVPLSGKTGNQKPDTLKTRSLRTDENKRAALNNIISTCKKENIGLVFVTSPMLRIVQGNSEINALSGLCSEQGITFINMSNDTAFLNNPRLFADRNHLNDEGARKFSEILAERIFTPIPAFSPVEKRENELLNKKIRSIY